MTLSDFNQSTLVPRFSYRRSPMDERAFLIFAREDILKDPRPVGDYTILDRDEDITLAEKKVTNLIYLMNGKDNKVVDLSDEAQGRTHFKILSEKSSGNKVKIMYYVQKREGVSKENALLQIESEQVQ